MTKPKILVTGSTGKTGTQVVAQLLEQGWPVRAVLRKEDARSERLRRLGAEVVVADLYDYEQMLEAMRGTRRAYYCPPVQPFMIQASAVFVAAARDAALESVAHLSMWLSCPAHPSVHTRQQWLTENLFAMIPGVSSTIINPGVFAGPILEFALPTAANLGVIPDPFGENFRNPAPSNEDIARVVVGVLTDPDRHAGKRYRPTGPKVLSMADIAQTVGRVLGRRVKLQAVSEKMFMKAAKVGGSGDFEISNVRQFVKDGKLGVFSVHAPTTDVLDVSGRPPEDFETTVRRYAAMPFARRSLPNTLRAIGDFARIMLTPALNADRYDARLEQPVPPNPQLAGESGVWEREHRSNGRADARPEAQRSVVIK